MKIFHGVVVQKSLKQGIAVEDLFRVINKNKKSSWGIKIVELNEEEFNSKISKLQKCMGIGTWYEHFYDDEDSLIIVFREKIFRVSKSKDSWSELIEYGSILGIPKEQLNIFPLSFGDEEEYVNS